MKQTLFTLLNTYGGVGREDAVRETIAELARPYCDEMRTDALGNLCRLYTSTSNCGEGLPIEPGQTFIHGKVPTVTHNSVCPKISRSSWPVSYTHLVRRAVASMCTSSASV